MPIIKCLTQGCDGKLRPIYAEGQITDRNGDKLPEYRHYECETCQHQWTYSLNDGIWHQN